LRWRPLDRDRKYIIAFNTFDPAAPAIVSEIAHLAETPAVNCTLHQSADARRAHRYFRRHKIVHRSRCESPGGGGVKRRVTLAKTNPLPLCVSAHARLRIFPDCFVVDSRSAGPSNHGHPVRRLRCRCTGRFCRKGPNSLIDRLDTQDLNKERQKDALIMFNWCGAKGRCVEWSADVSRHAWFGFCSNRNYRRDSRLRLIPDLFRLFIIIDWSTRLLRAPALLQSRRKTAVAYFFPVRKAED